MAEVIILGARSWIGFRLAEAIAAAHPKWRVLGTSSVPTEVFPSGAAASPIMVRATTAAEFCALVCTEHPQAVINLLRGEDDNGLFMHIAVAQACADIGCRYLYASSVLALDGYPVGSRLTEELPSRSITPYGQFKGACEAALATRLPAGDWQILRFASIQGWSPWKPSRNETFIRKLAAGTPVVVDVGVWQNRLQDRIFAAAVVEIATRADCRGVFHFGTDDASDEVDFLRATARLFELDEALVRDGGRREVNLTVSCDRLHTATAGRWRRREAQTLAGLRTESGLLSCLSQH